MNVAVVVTLLSSRLTDGLAFSNDTAPGPRNTLHVTVGSGGPGVPRPRAPRPAAAASAPPRPAGGGSLAPRPPAVCSAPRAASAGSDPGVVSCAVATFSFGGSSVTHALSVSGIDTSALNVAAI